MESYFDACLGMRAGVNPHLDFLLSAVYDNSELHPEHAGDFQKSGIWPATITLHKIRSIPPAMIDPLAGFPVRNARSALLFPFPDPRGGWMDHVKMKVFSNGNTADVRGDEVEERRERWRYNGGQRKYLTRRAAPPRLFFCLQTLAVAVEGPDPLWIVEGMKKALAAAQLGLPAVGIESAWGWHEKGSRELLPDFGLIALQGRTVKLVPDSDAQTTPPIARAMHHLGEALERRGARVELVMLPLEVPAA